MSAFPCPAGIGVVNKLGLEYLFNLRHKEMMHHPVPEIGGEYLPEFRLFCDKADRAGRPV